MPPHLLNLTFVEWCIVVTPPLVVLFYLKNIFFDGRADGPPCPRCARRRKKGALPPAPSMARPCKDRPPECN